MTTIQVPYGQAGGHHVQPQTVFINQRNTVQPVNSRRYERYNSTVASVLGYSRVFLGVVTVALWIATMVLFLSDQDGRDNRMPGWPAMTCTGLWAGPMVSSRMAIPISIAINQTILI